MGKRDFKIVFMGTPDFAAFSLRHLLEHDYNITGVVTMPDKPMGRHGSVLQSSPVKKTALEAGIPVLQPEKLTNPLFLEQLRALCADLHIVVAFRMLPKAVWAMPRLGTFNLHASLLPQYRGAAPINWAIINGETETGVTTFFLDHEIDTGDIIDQVKVPINPDDNAGTLHDKLMEIGAELVSRTVDDIIAGRVRTMSQLDIPLSELRPAPKIFKENSRIDWNMTSRQINNFIRGLSPYPAAWTILKNPDGRERAFKIFEAEPVDAPLQKPGTVWCDGRRFIEVSTADGALRLLEIQAAGKKRLPVCAFLCGNDLTDCCYFE